ncbi:MAG: flavodoxin family protein [Eubacteriales bacterium]|nr:flavodoxin family protein [Eubacteriales bacterium]
MKIVLLTGSAHKNGTTAALANQFVKGASEAGHTVFRFDAAFQKVHPCIGCEKCHNEQAGCAFKDDMELLNPQLLAADAVVLVSPIYYYDINAQLKTVIDRFYAHDAELHGHKKAVLMVALADDQRESANGAVASFENMAKYLDWQVAGTVVALGCGDANALEQTDYPQQAFALGRSI